MSQAASKEILLETGTNELEVLEFFIEEGIGGGQHAPCHFGVNVAKVMQVIETPDLHPLEAPPHPCYLGTIPLRDRIVPVLDLSIWLGMEMHRSDYEVVIVTEFSQSVTGFLVSGVTEIHRLGWERVEPPSGYLAQLGTGVLIGMVNLEDHFIQLLDLESILSDLDPALLESAGESAPKASKAYRALVVDDSATIRLMLKKQLEAAGFDLTILTTGEEAINHLTGLKKNLAAGGRINDHVDIVIADIEMPRMDGFSLTKRIKEDEVLGELPVMLYSSLITDELRHKGESVRADDQVSKPEMDRMAERAIRLLEGGGA